MDVTDVFVGRTAELATLVGELGLAAAGRGRTVVVQGAPGTGKTRLVQHALELTGSTADDRVVLHGGCVERPGPHYPSVPFAPFVEALRRLRGTDAPPEVLAAARAWVRPCPPADGRPEADTSAGEDQVLRRFTEMLDVLEAVAAWRPVVLVVDDLQWADPSSLALLVFLARAVTTEPVALVAALRDAAATRHEHLDRAVAELHRAPAVCWLRPDRLPDDDVAALVHRVRGPGTTERDVAAVVRRAEGNALAAAELAQHHGGDDELPRSYTSAVVARLAGLSPGALHVLRVAATIGRPVEPELLDRLTRSLPSEGVSSGAVPADAVPSGAVPPDASPDDVPLDPGAPEPARDAEPPAPLDPPERSLAEAVQCGLLVHTSSGYALRHGLDREVVYRAIPPWLARRLHAHVARELEQTSGSTGAQRLAEIADHWSRSGHEAAALRTCLAAGRAAIQVRAFLEAVALLRRALGHRDRLEPPLSESMAAAADIRLELAEALRLGGDVDAGIALLEDTLRAPMSPETEACCWERLAWFRRETGDGDGVNAAYLRALESVALTDDSPTRARVMASHAASLMIFGRFDDAGARAQEALTVALASGADAARAGALDTLGVVAALRGDADEGLRALREARDVAAACGSDEELWRAVSNTAYVLQNVGREAESVEVVTQAVGALGTQAHPPVAITAVGNAVSALILLGRWDEAMTWIGWCTERRPPAGLAAHIALTEAEVRVYRDDHATEALAAAHGVVDRSAEPDLVAALWRVEADHLAWHGRTAAARDAVDRSIDALGHSDDPESLLHTLTVGLRVEADATVLPGGADDARVQRLGALAASVAASSSADLPDVRLGSALCTAETARARGAGDQPWSDVAELARRLDRPFRLAYAQLRLAEHRLATGARRDAGEPLAEAHAVAERLGAAPLVAAAQAVARRSRLPLAAPPTPDAPERGPVPFGLTARELEVLHLLADGASNRQIARSLFISERTAGVHVSHILAKVGAGSRQQAAAAAHRAGLLATR
ncbi:AAA family ATPase [uncultured Cellulomonas sp.]|uniref:ATP-binding protein n=1 Tax=uncultured Cellulomonas sp. TaxID=189682 RepID=UPI002606D763|nr:LuxR family transcriptional regulator [uncultured Cellulomonas sp.]